MRITMDPIPLVLGIYAHAGEVLRRATQQRENGGAAELVRRFSAKRGGGADREAKRLVRKLHADVKTADKLLRKTTNVWKISSETDLVNLTIHARGVAPDPEAYVLLRPEEIRPLLEVVRQAAEAAGETAETLEQLQQAGEVLDAAVEQYLVFGFDPWDG